MSEPYIGEIRMVGFNYAPRGWAFCQGQTLAISTNTALFSLLGTTYGGNGQTTFALPDLRGRSPVGEGTGPGLAPVGLGESSGAEQITILTSQMPAHNHGVSLQVGGTSSNPSSAPSNTNNVLGASGGGPGSATIWSDSLQDPVSMAQQHTDASGASHPLPIRNPYLGIHFIIALTGIFPPRN